MDFHDKIMLPDLGKEAVMASIREAEDYMAKNEVAEKETALDFYYNRNLDTHLEQWFPGTTLNQIPPFGMRVVPRFARSRMMLYKKPPIRLINGSEEISEEYLEKAHHLDSKIREFSEIGWLLGKCHFRSKYNEKKQRIEYDILPHVKEYYLNNGETDPYGVSYEIGKNSGGE